MFSISLDPGAMSQAANAFATGLDAHVREGFEMTLESIAAHAKQTSTFVDRTSALRNSIMSAGVEGSLNDASGLVGTVSFAATSERKLRKKRGGKRRSMGGGAFYGVFLEYGTRSIKEKRFIRDAIDQEDGAFILDAVRATFRDAGFEVA